MEIDRNGLEVLSRAECLRLLADARVGRVVVTDRALPAAFPVHFALLDGDVVFLTTRGSTLEAAAAGHVVGFEADETDPDLQHGWSVLVQGGASIVEDPDALATVCSIRPAYRAQGAHARFVRVRSEIVSGRRLLASVPEQPPGRAACPSCGGGEFLPVNAGGAANFVCISCAACWRVEDRVLRRIDPSTCAGCSFEPRCTAAVARDRLLASTPATSPVAAARSV